ncbi:MAG: hypothetical protein ACPGVT_08790 [Maricaulaceae bacterium]
MQNLDLLEYGLICNFTLTPDQKHNLKKVCEKVNLKNTLFTHDQALNMELADKINAQISEYYLSYGLGGAFVRSTHKKAVTLTRLSAIDLGGLQDLLAAQMTRGLAMKSEDIKLLAEIIYAHAKTVDINAVQNNELRVQLLSSYLDTQKSFENVPADDLVRLIVHRYTDSTLLIKSQSVIDVIKEADEAISPDFLFQNRIKFAQVFNRYKPIFLALKKSARSKTAVNLIARLSKTHHKPIGMPKSRVFIADFLTARGYPADVFDAFSIFDKFRILNTLAVHKAGLDSDVYQIRNGKLWYQDKKKVIAPEQIDAIETYVLSSLRRQLTHLQDSNIKLPKHIRYGLPISEKQSLGKLPFGTVIPTQQFSKTISVGVYWENKWGAQDLDLSLIDLTGQRTGWGDAASYNRDHIQYSGDITNAPEGAMEFMTVTKSGGFGLFVNIYSGTEGCGCKLLIGEKDPKREHWMDEVFIDEKTHLNSRNTILGFVNPQNEFIIYQGRLGNGMISSDRNKAVIERTLVRLWTINDLFEKLDITYDAVRPPSHDLSYDRMSYEALVSLFETR